MLGVIAVLAKLAKLRIMPSRVLPYTNNNDNIYFPVMKKQLTSDLAVGSNGKSIKFTKITNTKDVFVKEKNIFLVDLACPGIPEFLQQVYVI